MIIFIKKVKTREGINNIDLEKIAKSVPQGYKAVGEPAIAFTANHVVVSIQCQLVAKPQSKARQKSKSKRKKPAEVKK